MVTAASRNGFTLVELLIALVVLSILVAIASPAFSTLIAEQRIRAAATELRVGISLARSEAIKRNAGTVLQGLAGSSSWSTGWEIEVPEIDGTTRVITEYALPEGVSLASGPSSATLTFSPWGRPSTACPKFQVESNSSGGTCKACLYVQVDGRVLTGPGACSTTSSDCSPSDPSTTAWAGACP